MKFYHYIILIFALLSLICCGQIDDNSVKKKGNYTVVKSYTNQLGFQYLTPDSTYCPPLTKVGYTMYLPKGDIKGAFVYPGIIPDSTIKNDALKIIQPALENKLAVIFLSTGKDIDFLFTDEDINVQDSVLNNALIKANLKDKPTIWVGLSLGGTMVMRHAEYFMQGKSKFGIEPSGLIIVDAPLDFVKWWYSCKNDIKKNYNSAAVFEASWTTYWLEKNLNGTPETALDKYIAYSPYVKTDTIKNKLALFDNIPIIAITEPDILWWMEERGKDYYDINCFDLAAFINDLRLRGNKEARLIVTTEKGYRENGMRHPHSWSIVDIDELISRSLQIIDKD
jgi:hypothetical protein